MKIQNSILLICFISLNIYAQDSCTELTQDECAVNPNCEINYDAAGQFEGCMDAEGDGPPECILDCPGIEDIISDDPYQLCEWIISFNGTECTADCEEELLLSFEYMADACENCLSDTTVDCADIFEDGDDDDNDDDGPPECTLDCPGVFDVNSDNPDEICDWIISINGTECMEDCDQETMLGFEYLAEACYSCLSDPSIDCADIFGDDDGGEDDGGWNCSDINNPEECYQIGCEWTTITTPNGVFEMCTDPDSNDDGGWGDGCFENGMWYCYGCEMFINECEYYECTENGWSGPYWNSSNPNCDNNGDDGGDFECSDLGYQDCMYYDFCDWVSDSVVNDGYCVDANNDDGPPECLLDCEGIEYVDPNEDPYEACDWIISNFGPNNFFNECAYDCDEETMEIINQISEACFMCLSDVNIDCADVWEDEGEDDGGGEEGCLDDAGQWYDYGFEMFVNDCEFYECTEDGWMGPFIIDNCWNNCYEITNEAECWANLDCMWIYDSPNNNSGYCTDNDNPPGDGAILRLEHATGIPGASVSVPLILSNVEPVGGLQFSLGGYTMFEEGITIEGFESTNDCFSASYNELDEGMIGIIFSLEGCDYDPSDFNHIADISFYINDGVPVGSEVPLWFNYTLVSNPSGNEIPSYGEESSISIGMQGDVNFDGEINVLDVVMMVNFAIYSDEPSDSQFWASDVNHDGQINILDIVQLINIILGR